MTEKDALKEYRLKALQESIARVTDEKLSWKEIKRRVAQGDITYIIALTIAKRKIEEFENKNITHKSSKYMLFYDHTRLIAYIVMIIYMCLSFFQKPSWCREAPVFQPDNNSYFADCSGTTIEGHVIPTSTIPYLKDWVLAIIEVVCVTFLTSRRYVKSSVKKKSDHGIFRSILAITFLIYLSDFLQYAVGITFPLNQILRPIYFIAYSRTVWSNLRLYCRIFWRSKEIFIVIAGTVLFYVCVARVIFYQTEQNAAGPMMFGDFGETLYNLFVALTTANYPDLMMPIFQQARYSSLYFISFMAITNLVLLNIIIAYFYFNYKDELFREARLFQRRNSKIMRDLFETPSDEEKVIHNNIGENIGGTGALLQQPVTNKLYEEIGKLHKQEMKRMFGKSQWKRALLATLNLTIIKTIFAIGSLFAFVLLIIQSDLVLPGPQTNYTSEQIAFAQQFNTLWLIIELVLNAFIFLDPLLRVLAIGWKYFLDSWFFVFELSLSIAIIGLIFLKFSFIPDLSMTLIRVILLFRIVRFFRWVFITFESYNLIFKTLMKLVPLLLDVLSVLTIAFYLYSTLGEVFFGGYIKTNSNINFTQFGDPAYYVFVNFNDFAMGLYTCFHLLIVNNWLYTVDVHCRVMGSFSYRIFFCSFYIVTVVICLNILIAFILDIYVTQISRKTRPNLLYDPVYDMTPRQTYDEATSAWKLQKDRKRRMKEEEEEDIDSPLKSSTPIKIFSQPDLSPTPVSGGLQTGLLIHDGKEK